MHPLETGNIILIILGAVLVLSGPYIIYRTIKGILDRRKADPQARIQLFNSALNFLIAVFFFIAGILFIINNLRGNPLAGM
ncbi:MAG: hypothetical protein HY537_14550 [Deltaproteobacteria bacterium]|nr:hypothetical protein [Deltaproteobacteria bacterium]